MAKNIKDINRPVKGLYNQFVANNISTTQHPRNIYPFEDIWMNEVTEKLPENAFTTEDVRKIFIQLGYRPPSDASIYKYFVPSRHKGKPYRTAYTEYDFTLHKGYWMRRGSHPKFMSRVGIQPEYKKGYGGPTDKERQQWKQDYAKLFG